MKPFEGTPQGFVIHHSKTLDGKTVSAPAIRRHHIQVKGWHDIGYHALCELAGSEFEMLMGRPLDMQGAHCPQGGMNSKTWGVCLIGDFDASPPPKEQVWVAFERFLIPMARIHGITLSRSTVTFHRHHALDGRTCPGAQFTDALLDLYLKEFVK